MINNLMMYSKNEIVSLIKCLQKANLIISDKNINDLTDLTNKEISILRNNLDNDYLGINMGRDAEYYAWYLYGSTNIAVRVSDLKVIYDEKVINELFA